MGVSGITKDGRSVGDGLLFLFSDRLCTAYLIRNKHCLFISHVRPVLVVEPSSQLDPPAHARFARLASKCRQARLDLFDK